MAGKMEVVLPPPPVANEEEDAQQNGDEQRTENSTTVLWMEPPGTKSNDCVPSPPGSRPLLLDDDSPSSSPSSVPNLGDFVQFGRYTLFIILLYEVLLLPQMGNMTFMVYGGAAPSLLSCANTSFTHLSRAEDVCAAYNEVRDPESGLCPDGRPPETRTQFGSIANEFGFYCERIVHVKKSISAQMFGVLCGAIIFGQLSDWFGRKRIMLVAHLGMCLFNYTASVASSLAQFTLLQSAAMFFVGGHNTIMHVFLLENMPKRHRVWVMNAISYSPNYVLFAAIAYYSGEWRTLLQLISFLNVPAFIGLIFAFESPRWLIHKAKLDEAKQVLGRMERMNGTWTGERRAQIEELIEGERRKEEENKGKNSKKKYNYWHLFFNWRLSSYTTVISYSLLSISIVSYSMVFGLDALSGSIFLNTALFGLCRYSMNLLVGCVDFFAPQAGRRHIYSATVLLILLPITVTFASKCFDWSGASLQRLLVILAAALCSQLYMLNHVLTTELFPTAIRNTAASFVQIANRTGVVLSPHLFYLAFIWPPLPFLVMFLLLSLNLLLFLCFIPETKGNSLADHMPGRGKGGKSAEGMMERGREHNIEMDKKI